MEDGRYFNSLIRILEYAFQNCSYADNSFARLSRRRKISAVSNKQPAPHPFIVGEQDRFER